ncbi:MAG: hypothetical protein ABGW90_13740 [Martelella sp.]
MSAAAVTLFDKPAVAAPKRALTAAQREALRHVHTYRRHRNTLTGGWYLGPKFFKRATVAALVREGLVRREKNTIAGRDYRLELTMAGIMALEKLEKSDAR